MESKRSKAEPPRRTAVADAAIAVLAEQGGRGLTHRAIDRRLGLPLGSTANYFATREALLRAVGERLLALDVAAIGEIPGGAVSRSEAAAVIADRIISWLGPEVRARHLAHLELVLQSARDDLLRSDFLRARQDFVELATEVLTAVGCSVPVEHAPGLVALYDGLYLDQLFYAAGPPDRHGLVGHLERFLAGC